MVQYDPLNIADSIANTKIRRLINSLPHNINAKQFRQAIGIAKKGKRICDDLIEDARTTNNENAANCALVLKAYFELWESIAKYWDQLMDFNYNDAWGCLQDGLSASHFILTHASNPEQLLVSELCEYLLSYEEIFPYRVFASTGLVVIESHCNICGKNPYDPGCTHMPGELYMGEAAVCVVDKIEANEVSLVQHPEDKRCIIFLPYDRKHPENSAFRDIYRVSTGVEKPLQILDVQRAVIEENTSELHCPDDWDCPCGSGIFFKDCCMGNPKISISRIVHVQITKDLIKLNI